VSDRNDSDEIYGLLEKNLTYNLLHGNISESGSDIVFSWNGSSYPVKTLSISEKDELTKNRNTKSVIDTLPDPVHVVTNTKWWSTE